MKFLLAFCIIVSYFLPPSNCCLLSTSGECGVNRLTYGGRVSLPDQDVVSPGSSFPWMNRKMIILQVPRRGLGSKSFNNGFGRGRIWVTTSKQTCSGSSSQRHCPVTESAPCLDTSIPCYMDPPSFSRSEPLEFSDITPTSLNVSWPAWNAETDVGFGPIVEYKIRMRRLGNRKTGVSIFTEIYKRPAQLSHHFDNLAEDATYEFQVVIVRDHWNGDGSPSEIQTVNTTKSGVLSLRLYNKPTSRKVSYARALAEWEFLNFTNAYRIVNQTITLQMLELDGGCGGPEDESRVMIISNEIRKHRFDQIAANSLFNITVTVETTTKNFSASGEIRTVSKGPTGNPNVTRSKRRGRRVTIFWTPPACGTRNGEIELYEYTYFIGNAEVTATTTRLQTTLTGVQPIQAVIFKVKAISAKGYGPYSNTYVSSPNMGS